MRAIAAMAALLLCAAAPPASAWGWLSPPAAAPEEAGSLPAETQLQESSPPAARLGGDDGVCLAAIFGAEQRYGIPDHLLLALGLQEAGYGGPQGLTIWPWSVNAEGDGRRFENASEAIAFVRARQAAGEELIDIGCLQVNLRWHPEAFGSLTQGFDPHRNVDYAARFLLSLYAETGDWWAAAGRYHSRSEGPQGVYLASLRRNHQVALARLGGFIALAEAVGETLPAAYAFAALPEPARRSPTPYRTEGAIWGADLSGAEGGRRSLYSALDLEPILPAFLPPES